MMNAHSGSEAPPAQPCANPPVLMLDGDQQGTDFSSKHLSDTLKTINRVVARGLCENTGQRAAGVI